MGSWDLDSTCQSLSALERRPAKTVKTHTGSAGSTGGHGSRNLDWDCGGQSCSPPCSVQRRWERGCYAPFVLAVMVVVGPGGCCEKVWGRQRSRAAPLCTQLVFNASGEALSHERDDNDVAANASHAHTYCKHERLIEHKHTNISVFVRHVDSRSLLSTPL